MGDADRDCGHRSDGRRQAPGSHGLGQDKREDVAHHRASRRLLGNHLRRVSVSPQDIQAGVLASGLFSRQHSGWVCSSRLCSATSGSPAPRRHVHEPSRAISMTLISPPRITLHCMLEPLTKKELHELEEILRDPAKRRKQALKAIEAWVRQGTDKSGKSSKNSRRRS